MKSADRLDVVALAWLDEKGSDLKKEELRISVRGSVYTLSKHRMTGWELRV